MSFLAHILEEKAGKGLIAPCIYTTGFENQDFARLPALLDFLDAVLIDIRFEPSSGRQIQWRKDYLQLLLKDRYRHVSLLGNRPIKGTNRATIQNLSLGVKVITEMRANLLLMCECADLKDCHRRIISQELAKKGFDTQEIADWQVKN